MPYTAGLDKLLNYQMYWRTGIENCGNNNEMFLKYDDGEWVELNDSGP